MSLQCAILGCALLAVIVHAQPLEAAALAAPIIGEVIGAVIGGVAPLKLVVVASALAALSQRRAGGFAGAADAGTHARRHALHLRKERRVADRRVVAGVGRSVYLVLVPHLSALEFTVYPCHEGVVSAACVWSPTVHFRNRVSQCMCRLWFVCTASASASTCRNVGLFFCGLVPSSVSCCETCCVYPTIRSIRDEIRMLSTAVELTKLTSTFFLADGQPYLLRTIAAGDGSFVRFKRPWLCPTQYW